MNKKYYFNIFRQIFGRLWSHLYIALYLSKDFDTNKPIFFGRRFKPFTKQGYFSGGAGYVLSKEALKRFVETGLKDPELCRQDAGGAEDVEMGISLSDQQQVTSMFFTGAKSALLFCDQMFFFFYLITNQLKLQL